LRRNSSSLGEEAGNGGKEKHSQEGSVNVNNKEEQGVEGRQFKRVSSDKKNTGLVMETKKKKKKKKSDDTVTRKIQNNGKGKWENARSKSKLWGRNGQRK